jgi:prevent-host-death family protein
MSSISVSELKKKPAKQWGKSAKKGDLVVTSQGQPVAVLLPIDAESIDLTLATLRSLRALQAQRALQNAAVVNGTDTMSLGEIKAEIAAVRNSHHRK